MGVPCVNVPATMRMAGCGGVQVIGPICNDAGALEAARFLGTRGRTVKDVVIPDAPLGAASDVQLHMGNPYPRSCYGFRVRSLCSRPGRRPK